MGAESSGAERDLELPPLQAAAAEPTQKIDMDDELGYLTL